MRSLRSRKAWRIYTPYDGEPPEPGLPYIDPYTHELIPGAAVIREGAT